MRPSDLELHSTQELIDELMRRKTFLGVVVHSREELKGREWSGELVFTVHHNDNLSPEEAGRLLDVVAERLDSLIG